MPGHHGYAESNHRMRFANFFTYELRDPPLALDHVTLAIKTRRMHRVGYAHSKLQVIENHLENRCDDPRCTGGPHTRTGRPSFSTRVGVIPVLRPLPGAMLLGRPGTGSKLTIELLYMNPRPSGITPELVPREWVNDTQFPDASTTLTCVVPESACWRPTSIASPEAITSRHSAALRPTSSTPEERLQIVHPPCGGCDRQKRPSWPWRPGGCISRGIVSESGEIIRPKNIQYGSQCRPAVGRLVADNRVTLVRPVTGSSTRG
ncbi:MAG: hypothetical protein CM1200mP2_44530 [Planctomycetaceae bacterium]|nr:MAG: hypothetical protein CM1200mP2_44530 [Planctomycetaceae bacterium]